MTKRTYLFIYSGDVGTREEVRDYIDEVPEILNWRYDIPYAFYLVSECSADEIADIILDHTGGEGRFLVAEVTENSQGWLPKRTWRLLNEKPPAKSANAQKRKERTTVRRPGHPRHPATL